MQDTTLYLLSGATMLIGLAIVSLSCLKGWNQWIALRRFELERGVEPQSDSVAAPNMGSRIELADLRERVRQLEAIAAGVDL